MQLQGFRSQLRRAAKTPAKQRGAVCSPSRVSLPDPRTRLWPWVVSAGTDLRPCNAGHVSTGDGNGSAGRRERQSGALTGLVGRGPTPERCWIASRSKDLPSPCCFPSPRSHFHPPALQNQKLFKAQRLWLDASTRTTRSRPHLGSPETPRPLLPSLDTCNRILALISHELRGCFSSMCVFCGSAPILLENQPGGTSRPQMK